MKTIDIKSLIIGALFTSTVIFGVASTSPTDKWDKDQLWEITMGDSSHREYSVAGGYEGRFEILGKEWDRAAVGAEPFALQGKNVIFRRRIK